MPPGQNMDDYMTIFRSGMVSVYTNSLRDSD
jgi:hypothetical protein